jgi:hypothetical protein
MNQINVRMAPDRTVEDYYLAVNQQGPLAAQWKEGPGRLVYDLVGEVQRLQSQNPRIRKSADD